MGLNIAAAAAPGVSIEDMTQAANQSHYRGPGQSWRQQAGIYGGQAYERRQIRRGPISMNISFCCSEIARHHEPAKRTPSTDDDRRVGSALNSSLYEGFPVRQD